MTGNPVVMPNIFAFGYLIIECSKVNFFIFLASPFPLKEGFTIKPE